MTVRFKLTMTAIAVIVVVNCLLSLATVRYLSDVWINEVQTRVFLDLNSARSAYQNHQDVIASYLRGAAMGPGLLAAVEKKDEKLIAARLDRVFSSGTADFVSLLDGKGRVLYRARNPGRKGDDLSSNPLIAEVLRTQRPLTATVVLSREELETEGQDLADRARFKLRPTAAAHPTEETVRTEGMVAAAAVPVFNPQGDLVAFLYGGDLLNRRYEIVDAIKQEVFPPQVFGGRDIGTVTIFQGDLRISTNVIQADGSRAVGTRLSAAVYDEVVERGGTWAAPAFVVNDWYITAYEPIRDPSKRIVGALYVGLLQEPFLHRRNILIGVFLGMVLVATIGSLLLIFFVTELVLRPIGHIVAMQHKIVAGDLSARVELRPSGEMGRLCQAIDAMADALAEREERLRQATRQQISRSEQLASVGRLAAGVAHEINNPLTGVLTFAHLLREKANMDDQDRQDLGLIIHETARAAEIVRGLLDFARERPVVKAPVNLNDVVRQTVRLLGNREAFQRIVVVEDLAEPLPRVDGDANQLQQILVNLSLNACEAMPDGGTLLISTLGENGQVIVKVTDTGCGIKRDNLDKIFEPFFSTKPVGKGTGLGLSVSYGIIQQHGGTLEVESEEGKGSTFTIVLPTAASDSPGAPAE
jgi:two-component system NtrC family sensor kinase